MEKQMTVKTISDPTKPHVKAQPVAGGSRQFVHTDMIAIVTDAEPKTEFNGAGSRLIGELLPSDAPSFTVRRALVKAAQETGLPVFKPA